MPTISSTYVKPGVYFKITDVPAPIAATGDFIPLLVGLGRKEFDVLETLTRGDPGVSEVDLLTEDYMAVSILSIIDENDIAYTEDVDFLFERGSGVGEAEKYNINWESPLKITGIEDLGGPLVLTDEIFNINIDGTSYPLTFTAAETDIASIITFIDNAVAVGTATNDGSDHLVLNGDTVIINGGSSSSLTTLGFFKGQKVISIQPAKDIKYTVYYKRIKESTEYIQQIFTRIEDLYADQGDGSLALVPTTLFDETDASGITITVVANNTKLTTITDTNAAFIVDEVVPGSYLKITGGTGAGQIRVITEITSATAVIVPNFDEDIDATSTYKVTDIGDYQTSHAANLANKGGAQQFIVSQVYDDIVDDDNWRGSIDLTIQNVDGKQGWCLVPLMGLDVNESLVSYIKTYLTSVNSITGGKERMALFGVKTGLTAAQTISFLTGTADERVGIVTNPSMESNSNTYGSEYLAAYICGIICNPDYDAGEPISGKVIALDSITDDFTDFEKRQFGQNGGIVIEKQGVDNKIIHFLSTDVTDTIKSELKVIKQKDSLKKSLKSTLEKTIVNTRSLDIAKVRAESITRLVLEDKVNKTEINSFKNLSVEFETGNPRQLNISFLFKPTFDVNYVSVTFGATVSW